MSSLRPSALVTCWIAMGARSGLALPPRSPPVLLHLGHGLSDAERRVVALVSEGTTNRKIAERLFLSPYTVGTHLKHVFTMLGVSSRVALTRSVLEVSHEQTSCAPAPDRSGA
jgi:DNA-binding CsgD family transcriptional regulator